MPAVDAWRCVNHEVLRQSLRYRYRGKSLSEMCAKRSAWIAKSTPLRWAGRLGRSPLGRRRGRGIVAAAVSVYRNPNADTCALTGSAFHGQRAARLLRALTHRAQAKVAGEFALRIEAHAIISNL